jgi:hypothetical protein
MSTKQLGILLLKGGFKNKERPLMNTALNNYSRIKRNNNHFQANICSRILCTVK